MKNYDNLREAKERALERITLGMALVTLAGYIALAVAVIRRPKKCP